MRRFLYFFPNVGGMNPIMLAKLGALSRFTGSAGNLIEHCMTSVDDGPAGGGCIVAAGKHPPGKAQQWIEGETFWVGIEDFPPTPADLEREVGIGGYETALQGGCVWRIPLVRKWDPDRAQHVPNVPSSMQLRKGRVQFEIRPEYAAVDAIVRRNFEGFTTNQTVPYEALYADAVALLAVNYRIGAEEASLLGLFDEATILRVLQLSFDVPGIRRQMKAMSAAGLYASEG